MKNKIYNFFIKEYYLAIIFIYFIIFNIFITNLSISGIIYYIYLVLIVLITIMIIIKYNNTLKYKKILYLPFLICTIFSKNIFYVFLLLTIFILITFLNFIKSHVIKILSILATILIMISMPIFVFILVLFSSNDKIYDDTHYYCNNFEIYIHSSGAMDYYHYMVIKKHKIIELNNILEIVYNEHVGSTLEDYNNILYKNDCKLVSEVENGS